ncbi:outer membrane beta-barrel protein [Komagataeibacter sp. FNDCF1]|uniref:outer membrane beta-barrel protein n=1 Tax=Komagataeibacter sp. FNDCF1 TaxID=2878681 RepID=UPI001E444665|nr:outer membrane beta-barrel protein [Komagataeibacter sp. FNDCF1]MCE2565383.1 porin [Komagataeibacter sp. FNDCF1]
MKPGWRLGCFLFFSAVLTGPSLRAHAQVQVFSGLKPDSGVTRWLRDITLTGQIEGGIMANPARPQPGYNFGDFFADHANQVQLNQLEFTLNKAINSSVNRYQVGFTLEAMYGSDARYYHLLGISDREWSNRYQLIPAQAHMDVHLPWLTRGGLDMQAGILLAPMGIEGLDPASRAFYTLAYTSEYSVPFQHVGAMFTWHVTPVVDVTFGIDTGNQTTFGRSDNNNAPAGYFGFNLNNLAHGRLRIIELSRVGPEDSWRLVGHYEANHANRFWNDISAIYQLNKRLTLMAEFNYLHDEGVRGTGARGQFAGADAESFISFLSYRISDSLTFNYRGEIYRDNNNAMVATFRGNNSYMEALAGTGGLVVPGPSASSHGTTYGEMTLNMSYRPNLGHHVRVFQIRPEIRFDRALNGSTPFNGGRNNGMFTFGGDAVIGF